MVRFEESIGIMASIKDLRIAIEKGVNITSLLKEDSALTTNTDDIIELAYDLQAGSYIRFAEENKIRLDAVTAEMRKLASGYIAKGDSLLDCGAGELTTLSFFLRGIERVSSIHAFDISHSRVRLGKDFANKHMSQEHLDNLHLFVAEIGNIPMADRSIDVVMTSHALEPNHGREEDLISELARIASKYVILFEPSYEHNNDRGRARMEELGYVRDLPGVIKRLGLSLVSESLLSSPLNPQNPTCCYVIKIEDSAEEFINGEHMRTGYICPNSSEFLEKRVDHFWSHGGGYAYPLIDGIPILRKRYGVLKTKSCDAS